MSVLVFKLFNVPEDEADDVRRLLTEHKFDTYETHSGFFGLGVAAIWLREAADLAPARALIDAYQTERSRTQREYFAQQKAQGTAPTFAQKVAEQPVRFAATIAAIVIVALVSLLPIWILVGP